MSILLKMLLAVTSVTPGTSLPSSTPARPLHLAVEESAAGVLLKLVGQSDVACRATYRLEVSGGKGNRSTQSGTAQLQPGAPVTLVSLQLGGTAKDDWSARLSVSSCNGADYQEVKRSE